MKKSILAVAGIAALAGVAVPFARVDAATSQEDSLSIKIEDSCALAYQSGEGQTSHTDGGTSSAKTGTWGGNTLSATIANNSADSNIGGTNFNVVCNNLQGYTVALTAIDLTGKTNTGQKIAYITSASAPSTTTSEWGVNNGSNWILTTGTIKEEAAATYTTDFSVHYGVSATSTQAADTYGGTATYTLTKKSS